MPVIVRTEPNDNKFINELNYNCNDVIEFNKQKS
jgi:hypothetical protein